MTGRESIEAGREALESQAANASAGDLIDTADNLMAVTRFLLDQPRLRRALSDPAQRADDREGLARRVLEGKIGASALDVVIALVRSRWGSPGELANGVETVGVQALLQASAKEGSLATVEDELFRFRRIVDGDPELSSVLGSTGTEETVKVQIVDRLLDGKTDPVTVKLIETACHGVGGRSFDPSMEHLLNATAEAREQVLAYVTVASTLEEGAEQKIAAKLSLVYNYPVGVKVIVDPSVVGGIRIQVGSDLWDGTVSRRLNAARRVLAGR
ncbi:F0F1 ATP synthase subunit delta [Haloglycomyces albus]|uniref:F0F1 ATP synthase subunit delta n=1 Tax=Haloglycomyces albus TaxID=526067 RepID=UPI00146FC7E7|nr:F0F1 ATP synthase subunit delta [Haloglycomyces albus]